MTSGLLSGRFLQGLAFRVLFFLSLALLPIGLIAIAQARQILDQHRISGELSLLAVTEQASMAERRALQEAFGAADALTSIAALTMSDPDACSAFFSAYREETDRYGLAGFLALDGISTCNSTGASINLNSQFDLQTETEKPGHSAIRTDAEHPLGAGVTMIKSPVLLEGELAGFVVLTLLEETVAAMPEPELTARPIAVMTFNDEGELLLIETTDALSADEAPASVALQLFTGNQPLVFNAENRAGQRRVYAVQPIVSDAAFALSVWPTNTPFLQLDAAKRLSTLLPILMWAASLVVAFWALNRLAIRHIRKLGRQMRRFAINRDLPRHKMGSNVPSELVEMEAAFLSMGDSILRDEAQQEDNLREKNILLKEVHHRVKNNLQLISSIMNMQIRQDTNTDTQRVLRRLQDRILGLATVHKNLYQNEDLARVPAKNLLDEVVDHLLNVAVAPGSGIRVTRHFDNISLDADDAAPLTLLTSEVVTNALKHTSVGEGEVGRIDVALRYDGEDMAKLTVINDLQSGGTKDGTGLGTKLIDAFARQLNGQVDIEMDETSYALTVRFPVPERRKQVLDY